MMARTAQHKHNTFPSVLDALARHPRFVVDQRVQEQEGVVRCELHRVEELHLHPLFDLGKGLQPAGALASIDPQAVCRQAGWSFSLGPGPADAPLDLSRPAVSPRGREGGEGGGYHALKRYGGGPSLWRPQKEVNMSENDSKVPAVVSREEAVDRVLGPYITALNRVGVNEQRLARQLFEELQATEAQHMRLKGGITDEDRLLRAGGRILAESEDEVIIEWPSRNWPIQQRARQDAQKLMGLYPAERQEVDVSQKALIVVRKFSEEADEDLEEAEE